MDPRQLFADERHGAFCVFCGAEPTTREHVASRILLDDPLPEDLPLVYSCHACNNGFSRDEEYLACLIDCVVSGLSDPALIRREKVRASLRHSPALAARIAFGRSEDGAGTVIWKPEDDRVRNVIVKLVRAHAAHQYSERRLEELSALRKNLNPLSRFDFGSLAALAHAREWQAKERRRHEAV